MERIILGDGISGYIIAACLEYKGIHFRIVGNGLYKAPDILLLECETYLELTKYLTLFNIDTKEFNKYIKEVNIGFINEKFELIDSPDEELLCNYYQKQTRDATAASMSNGKSHFDAIDLSLVYKHLQNRYKKYHETIDITKEYVEELKKEKHCIIYNTIFGTECNNHEPTLVYLTKNNELNFDGYDYVYDCRISTKIKRYTKKYIEYFENPNIENQIIIKNYYKSPMIYKSTNIKLNNIWIDISRNATRTQLKQEDIIKYVITEEISY